MEQKVPEFNPKLPTFAFWQADRAGCGYVRCEVPARSINRLGLANVILVDPKNNSIPIVKFAMLQRNVSADRLEVLLRMRQEYGTLVVIEEDDNFTALPFDNPAFFEFHPDAFRQMGSFIKANKDTRQWDNLEDFGEKEGFVKSLKGQIDSFEYMENTDKNLEKSFEMLNTPPHWRKFLKEDAKDDEKERFIEKAVIWDKIPRNNFHEIHRHSISEADLVTVTTHHLADVYSKLNPNVVILPNCIDLEEEAYKSNTAVDHDGIIIGWAGSLTHLGDLKICAPAIKQVMKDNDNTRLFIGAEFRAYEQIFKDLPGVPQFIKKTYDFYGDKGIMASKASEGEESEVVSDCGRYIYRRGVSVAKYPNMLRDVDIGLVPGRYGMSFYEAKSDLKGLEMAGKKIPTIVSPLGEYLYWRPEATGCFIVKKNRHRMWHKYISLLVNDNGLREDMANRAFEFSKTRHIDRWAPEWVNSYIKRMNNLSIQSQS